MKKTSDCLNNIILDDLPCSYRGVSFNSDFKTVLKVFRVQNSKKEENEKLVEIARLFFGETAPTDQDVWNYLTYFVTMGEDSDNYGERLCDLEIDSGRIYAAFLQIYGIDLMVTDLHWWVFLELFQALPTGTKLQEVIDIRAKKVKASDSPEYKTWLAKAKARYSIGQQGSAFSALFGGFKNG